MMEECRRALELNPNLDQPHYFRARAFLHLGVLERVEPEVRLALERNPAGERPRARPYGPGATPPSTAANTMKQRDWSRNIGA